MHGKVYVHMTFGFALIVFDSISELFVDYRIPWSIYIAFCKLECDVLKLNDNKNV